MPSSTVYNLLGACREPGCPLCQLEQQSVKRYLDNQFYENVNSPRWRDRLRASLGFCHEHAWLGVDERLGDALGYSIIYRDLLNSVLRQWESQATTLPERARKGRLPQPSRGWIQSLVEALTPQKPCPVCEQRNETTRTYLGVLLEQLHTQEMSSALQASDGLCLPHLRLAFDKARDGSAAEQLLQIHRPRLEGLKAELEEFIRKNDYQAVDEGFGKEGDAWLRAIAMVVGRRK